MEGPRGGEAVKRASRSSSRPHDYLANSMKEEQKRLADAKKARVQVDKDAQLLANRIALLKQEEMRTWKKIEETRKRATEVFQLKKKNEESRAKNYED